MRRGPGIPTSIGARYTLRERPVLAVDAQGDLASVQSARPRDLGALVLVAGILAVLFVVSLALGRPGLR
jgi:hypothetical protein